MIIRTIRRIALLAAIAGPLCASAAEYVVVVNASNRSASISRDELARMFTLQTTDWPDGTHVKPADQVKGAKPRLAFSRDVLGMTAGEVEKFWIKSIYSGRAVPPPQFHSDAAVVAFVRDNPGGIGYVTPGTPLDGVKAIEVR